jgi:hypothetical protein
MSLPDKIASALRSLLGGKEKEAEHTKTLDLFGFPVAAGDDLIEVEDPQETPIETNEDEEVNENSKGEDTIADELTTPVQSEDAATGTGDGSDY